MSQRFDRLQVAPWFISLLQVGALSLVIIMASSAILIWGQVILAPLVSSIVIGLMFGPLADRIERFGVPSFISGAAVVMTFFYDHYDYANRLYPAPLHLDFKAARIVGEATKHTC